MIWVVACFFLQDDAREARLGELDPLLSAGARISVYPSPTLEKAVVDYDRGGKHVLILENGAREDRPIKWVGWKKPEGKSVVVAETDRGRRLLVGGVEEKSRGELWDAGLFRKGTQLILAARGEQGMTLQGAGWDPGLCESIEILDQAVVTRRLGKGTLHWEGRSFEVQGTPLCLFPCGKRLAWIEQVETKRQQAVVDGVRGIVCDSVHTGIFFSPNGGHVAYVTREAVRFRGWIDHKEIPSEHSLASVRAFDDGTPVFVEMWSEDKNFRGRITVGEKREDRVLPRPIFNWEPVQGRWLGASRSDTSSILVDLGRDGISCQEVPGRIGVIIPDREGKRILYTLSTPEGLFLFCGGKKHGPFDRVEPFLIEATGRFGWVASKDDKVRLYVEDKVMRVELEEFFPPVRISETGMTAAVIGVQRRKGLKEIWVRILALE